MPVAHGETGADAIAFLDGFVDPDGRVVRRDQGDDTVSEGQAYALLVAVGIGDQHTFDQVWDWTKHHLERPDGLLSWRWAAGGVTDPAPAADADLDAAWALALAEQRWPSQGYGDAAVRLLTAVTEHETAVIGGEPVLVAGPWARGDPAVINPSYFSPVAVDVLEGVTGRAPPDDGTPLVSALIDQYGLPPDWAAARQDGSVEPLSEPGDREARGGGSYGWDAVRVPLRHAPSCDASERALAAAVWRPMHRGAGAAVMGDHPARLVGAAAAAAAAGDADRAHALLDEASDRSRAAPSYYGSALTALGRLLLTTAALGGCPPLAP